jgi:hypothetical protein
VRYLSLEVVIELDEAIATYSLHGSFATHTSPRHPSRDTTTSPPTYVTLVI